MVIQRGKPANVWGYVQDCSGVTVEFNGKKINATVTIVQGKGRCLLRQQVQCAPLDEWFNIIWCVRSQFQTKCVIGLRR